MRVVDQGSFTLAAGTLGLTASGVSRAVTRLEARLGVRLLERTTRSVGLTAEGAVYYERCTQILRDLEDAEGAIASARSAPRGRLRVDAPSMFGTHVLGPELGRFLETYPDLALDLSLRDHVIDPIAEGVDVVLRMAELRDSELIQKNLGTMSMVIVGTPTYFERKGRPRSIDDLSGHDTLGFLVGGAPLSWKLRHQGSDLAFPPSGRLSTNSIAALLEAVRASQGIIQVFERVVRHDIEQGTFEVVLGPEQQTEVPLVALFSRGRGQLPKVRAFLAFMEDLLTTETPSERSEGFDTD